jgi:hypothetical protein
MSPQSTTPAEYFVYEAAAYARSLPLPDCARFLRGMLESVPDEQLTGKLRTLFPVVFECDRQLELIATGQMKLGLDEPETLTPDRERIAASTAGDRQDGSLAPASSEPSAREGTLADNGSGAPASSAPFPIPRI